MITTISAGIFYQRHSLFSGSYCWLPSHRLPRAARENLQNVVFYYLSKPVAAFVRLVDL